MFTPQVLIIKKLGWGDLPLVPCSVARSLFVTGDTAKYLVLHSREVCARSPQDSTIPKSIPPGCGMGERKKRQDFSEVITQTFRRTRHFLHIYIFMSRQAGIIQHTPSRQSPYCHVAALEATSLETGPISLVLGGQPQVWYTRRANSLDSG